MNANTTRLNKSLIDKFAIHIPIKDKVNNQLVHLGIGAFHRAHQAVYTQNANQQSNEKWQIIGVSLRSGSVRDQLVPQDGFYTVTETDVSGSSSSIVSVIDTVLVAPENPAVVLGEMCHENTKIVSLTITEKGYCHDPATGNLDQHHRDIQYDLTHLASPKTAIGFLVSSLKTRFENNQSPFTVLCCDNLPSNGKTLATIVQQFASLIDKALAEWIRTHVPFPNTMVDRIVPATTEQDIDELYKQMGYQDLAMVKTERFSQWVIEDKFVANRPQWENVGASVVADVEPYENAKLRMLNGSHSSLAYIGYLLGYDYVHQVMQDETLKEYLQYLMQQEIIPTIDAPQGMDLQTYSESLLVRFSNPALNHRTYQIAMDGSQKLPQRILHTIENRLEQSAAVEGLCFSVAVWLRYTMAFDLNDQAIEVQDPLAAQLLSIYQQNSDDIDELVAGYLEFDKVFSARLKNSVIFKQTLTFWLTKIMQQGPKASLVYLLQNVPKNTD